MHARLSILSLVLALAGCTTETVARPPPPPMNWASLESHPPRKPEAGPTAATASERAAAKRYLEALASPEMTKLGPVIDETAHFVFAGSKDAHGRENVVKMHDALLGGVADRSFAATRVLITDSSQVIEWTLTGANRSGEKKIGLKGVTAIWTKDDGTITDLHLFFDESALNAQLGLGPKALEGLAPASAPTDPVQELEQTQSEEEKANSELVRSELQALEDGREPAYLATMSDDVEIYTLEGAAPFRGKAEGKKYFNTMHKAINYLATSIENIWSVNSFVAVEYHILGEQQAPIGWIPVQKNAHLKMSIVDVLEIKEAKIARIWRYDNPIQIAEASR